MRWARRGRRRVGDHGRLQVCEPQILAAIGGVIGVADLLAVDDAGLDEATIRSGDAGDETSLREA